MFMVKHGRRVGIREPSSLIATMIGIKSNEIMRR
jgi:hypothetical protein